MKETSETPAEERTTDQAPPQDAHSEGERGDRVLERWMRAVEDSLADAETASVDLYLRSLLPPAGAKSAQTAVVERLDEVADDGCLDDVRVNVWGERLCLCGTCADTAAGRAMLDTVREFESWAERQDPPVDLCFERVGVESTVTGDSYEGIRPPRVTAAVYADSDLVCVVPCEMGGRHCSVSTLCHALERAGDRPTDRPVEQS